MLHAFLLCALFWSHLPTQGTNALAPPASSISKEQWHQDLTLLAAELPKRHANAFHFLSEAAFDQEVNQLDRALDGLNRDEIFVGMDHIENSIGDGHTYIRIPADAPIFPAHFEKFGEDYRLVSTQDVPGAREALGGRLLEIDDMQIDRAVNLLLTLTPADETQALRNVRATAMLNDGMVLHGLGITPDRDIVHYVVTTDAGSRVTLQYRGEANQYRGAEITSLLEPGWLSAVAHPALYLQHPEQKFWCTYISSAATGYCNFRSYEDLKRTSRALTELMQHSHPDILVIDLRLNAGGDFNKGLKYVVNPIRHMSSINRHGHLFVLTGPRTFSAAMANAAHFRKRTKAILVGQPIGEKPNSYQEAREMVLPNSRWVARYSIRFYRFVSGEENLIRPDKEITERWEDFQSGVDPAMEWVLGIKADPASLTFSSSSVPR